VNADEIRDEAIERVARAFYESWREIFNAMPKYPGDGPEALPYDEAADDYKMKRGYRRQAAEAVDALGDLLPTVEEFNYFKTNVSAGVVRARRYMTEWREVA
jgi:hypothetical protein